MLCMSKDQLHNRLRRLEGQLKKLQEDIDDQKDCNDVITQFLAVRGAMAGAFEEYVKLSLNSCAKSEKEKMEKLIAVLVRS